MGIDIRKGQQMECITCALCIDACDDIMGKIGRPRGLIDYLALSDTERETAGHPPRPVWQHILRPRTVLYTALWCVMGLALVFALFIRPDIEASVAPIRNPTFITLSDGAIRNTYEIRLRNKHPEERRFALSVHGDLALQLVLEGTPYHSVMAGADDTLKLRAYVNATPGSAFAASHISDLRFWIEDLANGDRVHVDTTFNGKGGKDD
jgi:polyferredoxin